MTERRKRPFYIIGHNPNTIKEVKEYLESGANALEPDVIYAHGKYYISHMHPLSYDDVPTVENYLKELKDLIITGHYNLALIIFDLKDNTFDINELISIVNTHFSGGICDGIALLFTHSNDHEFVSRYSGGYPNVGVGVDESNTPPSELESFFKKAGQKNFSYADGITTFLTKPGVYTNIRQAQECRNRNEPDSFSLVYTWSLSLEGSMRKYLDTYIDGLFVDPPAVKELLEVVQSSPYNEVYEIAKNRYNPFTTPPMPKYILSVKTKDRLMAGTDAHILFTLKGRSGTTLKSLPFNGNLDQALERNTTTRIQMEGIDLGEIESLTVEALTDDINADWLPEYISVESKLLNRELCFDFNTDHQPELWISYKSGPVTKKPD